MGHHWTDKGEKAMWDQVKRVIDANAKYGEDSPEANAERAKQQAIQNNPKYRRKK